MEQLILNIKEKDKIPFLKELFKHMDFVEVMESKAISAKEKRVLHDLEEAVDFVNKYQKGEVKAKTFNQLLHEL